jgi:hypothetical protein
MRISTKETIAIAICLGSAIAAIAALRAGFHLPNLLMGVALVWLCVGRWASPLPWPGRKNFAELFALAQREKLKESRVTSIVSLGGMTIMVLSSVVLSLHSFSQMTPVCGT